MTERFHPTAPAIWSRPDVTPAVPEVRPPADGRPARPALWQERLGHRLLLFLSPRLARTKTPDPPGALSPFSRFEIERSQIERSQALSLNTTGRLSALWYPALGEPRGAVLLVHPWLHVGQSFFYRRGRLPALREAGYHAFTFDLGGVGHSGPAPSGFYDRDLEDALAALEERAEGLPLHLWGVSAGGYWAHTLLSRHGGVSGAFFEDVSTHLIEWSKRMAPWGMPFYLFFQSCLPGAYRFLDLCRHAPSLRVERAAYVSGCRDRGVRPEDTRKLARLASARCLVVEGADHLQAARYAQDDVVRLALDTFTGAGRRTESTSSSGEILPLR